MTEFSQSKPDLEFQVLDLRGTERSWFLPYSDWTEDAETKFEKSVIESMDAELESLKVLLMRENFALLLACVLPKILKLDDGTTAPVIVVVLHPTTYTYLYKDAIPHRIRIHIVTGHWRTASTSLFPGANVILHAQVEGLQAGQPISIRKSGINGPEVSGVSTAGASVFGYSAGNSTHTPDSVYTLTTAHTVAHLQSDLSPPPIRISEADLTHELVFPAWPSHRDQENARRQFNDFEVKIARGKQQLVAARLHLLNLATDVDAVIGGSAFFDCVIESLNGRSMYKIPRLLTVPEAKMVAAAWREVAIQRADVDWEQRMFNVFKISALHVMYPPIGHSDCRIANTDLTASSDVPLKNLVGHLRAAAFDLEPSLSSSPTASGLTAPYIKPSPSTLPAASYSSSSYYSSSSSEPPPTLPYLDGALFEITKEETLDKVFSMRSEFTSVHETLEPGTEVGMVSWAAEKHLDPVFGRLEGKAFFVHPNLPSGPEGTSSLHPGRVILEGRAVPSASGRFIVPGGSGAVVFTMNGKDRVPVGLAVGVFEATHGAGDISLVLPLTDLIPRLETVVQQSLVFRPINPNVY